MTRHLGHYKPLLLSGATPADLEPSVYTRIAR